MNTPVNEKKQPRTPGAPYSDRRKKSIVYDHFIDGETNQPSRCEKGKFPPGSKLCSDPDCRRFWPFQYVYDMTHCDACNEIFCPTSFVMKGGPRKGLHHSFHCHEKHMMTCPVLLAVRDYDERQHELMIDESPDEISDFGSDSEMEEAEKEDMSVTTTIEVTSPKVKRLGANKYRIKGGFHSQAVKAKPATAPPRPRQRRPEKMYASKTKPAPAEPVVLVPATPSPSRIERVEPSKRSILILGGGDKSAVGPAMPPKLEESYKQFTQTVYEPQTALSYICANPTCSKQHGTRLIPKTQNKIWKQRFMFPGTQIFSVISYCSQECFEQTCYFETRS